jgi:Asp-tRNA(Asn)/Glu-tRNA(Gln) amidotransferase A subunit family amidase
LTVAVVDDHWPREAAFKKGDDMGAFTDFDRYDGLGLVDLVRTGDVRSSELAEEAISRIETRNPQINAIATLPFDTEQWMLAFMTILAGETQSDIRSASAWAGRLLGFKDFEASTYIAGLLGSAWSAADYASAAKYLQA